MIDRRLPGRIQRRGLRPSSRGLVRVLLGVALILVGVLTPLGASHLPGELVNDSAALAQTVTRTLGNPSSCPSTPAPWTPRGPGQSECALEMEPCTEDPLHMGQFLSRSIEFPDFCESSVLQPDDPTAYTTCIALTGYAVLQFTTVDVNNNIVNGCRIVLPSICPGALVRVNDRTCRGIQRRSWDCPATYRRGNQFNVCYQIVPGGVFYANPACAGGGPDFGLVSCEEYVGGDFLASPWAVPCATYVPTALAHSMRDNTRSNPVNLHWCEFDNSLLNVDCHLAGANCVPEWHFCIKRESQVGGCSSLGRTINCRALQAAFADPNIEISAESIRVQGCEPCTLLPFQPPPSHCPDDIINPPVQSGGSTIYETLFRVRQDLRASSSYCFPVIYNDEDIDDHPLCKSAPSPCPDPPAGRLSWSGTHASQLAIVNSPVILRAHDVTTAVRTVDSTTILENFRAVSYEADFVLYAEPEANGRFRRLALWQQPDPSIVATTISQLVNGRPYVHECTVKRTPYFKIVVEVLWPDDKGTIEALFGSGTVDWWHVDLPLAEQERRTVERGLQWIDLNRMSPDDITAIRRARNEELSVPIECNSEASADVWCRWVPTRPGYYKLALAGAWLFSAGQTRGWIPAGNYSRLQRAVSRMAADPDEQARVRERLDAAGLVPSDVGLTETLDGLAPPPRGVTDDIFRASSDGLFYPFFDFRVQSIGDNSSTNYTESEPIGIVVHEVRVSTRAPTQ